MSGIKQCFFLIIARLAILIYKFGNILVKEQKKRPILWGYQKQTTKGNIITKAKTTASSSPLKINLEASLKKPKVVAFYFSFLFEINLNLVWLNGVVVVVVVMVVVVVVVV